MPIVVPVYGSELLRSVTTPFRKTGEIHSVPAARRIFLKDVCVTPKYHGGVASQAAMLALNTAPLYCFPDDEVFRTDASNYGLWRCIANRGTSLSDWEKLPVPGIQNYYVPLTTGEEPIQFVSDGAGRPIFIPYTS